MRHEVERRLRRAPKSDQRDTAFRKAIRSIPKGKVATYGQVAAAAGYPLSVSYTHLTLPTIYSV